MGRLILPGDLDLTSLSSRRRSSVDRLTNVSMSATSTSALSRAVALSGLVRVLVLPAALARFRFLGVGFWMRLGAVWRKLRLLWFDQSWWFGGDWVGVW